MTETSHPQISVDDLIDVISETARRNSDAAPAQNHRGGSLNWPVILASLESAEQHAQVGRRIPPLAAWRGIMRPPARLAARIVLYLSRFLTDSQTQLNVSLLHAVRALAEGVHRLEKNQKSFFATSRTEDGHALDSLYVALQDQFRGSREDIKERLRIYLPMLEDMRGDSQRMSVLDLGCGRGEWLELLREAGWLGVGVDTNRVMVEQCRQRGLTVVEADATQYLRGTPTASVAAVTAFHVVEHLRFAAVVELIDEAVRVLEAGGIAIFETPNPENVLVGSCSFYCDPSHHHPLPAPVLKFVTEARGLRDVQVIPLHPFPQTWPADESGLMERLRGHFDGPRDYSVVGRKP
jgi:SAM-dependent methyltransferase